MINFEFLFSSILYIKGVYLSNEEMVKATEYIYTLALNMPDIDPVNVSRELALYRAKEGTFWWHYIEF